ncbi:MAG: type II toxin-antitoxin system RelE/ParE family toxin [bacterium]|nr:type II toxin-antitoxin system RelE/ParE family toxin [bacterium]
MNPLFVLSAAATRDLDEILEYVLDQAGPRRAQHVADRLYDSFGKLSRTPGMGHWRRDLTQAAVRFWPVWSFLVIYRPDTKPLEIVRVLHGARDLAPLLEDL